MTTTASIALILCLSTAALLFFFANVSTPGRNGQGLFMFKIAPTILATLHLCIAAGIGAGRFL